MTHDATDCDGLTPTQERAKEAMLAGASITATAAQVGVGRSTVHRWLADPAFEAALNRARSDARRAHAARLEYLADRALGVVADALGAPDPGAALKAAVAVLRGVGLLSGTPAPIGSDDPAQLAAQQQSARTRATLDAFMQQSWAEAPDELTDDDHGPWSATPAVDAGVRTGGRRAPPTLCSHTRPCGCWRRSGPPR